MILLVNGFLPGVAGLLGGSSILTGFLINMIFSVIIGMSYGVLFLREAPNVGSGILWGLLYGLIWWFIGLMTLLPLLSGAPLSWTIANANAMLPSLIGHLIYGAVAAIFFYPSNADIRAGCCSTRSWLREKSGADELQGPLFRPCGYSRWGWGFCFRSCWVEKN